MKLVMHNNRIRRVVSTHGSNVPDSITAEIVTGYRRRGATSGRMPGPGWKRIPGDPRRWFKLEPIVEEVTVRVDQAIDCDDWPEGLEGTPLEDEMTAEMMDIIRPRMESAVKSGGVVAQRAMPQIKIETIEYEVKSAGLPMPTEDEWIKLLNDAWDEVNPKGRAHKRKKAPKPSGAITTPPPETDDPVEKAAMLVGDDAAEKVAGEAAPDAAQPVGDEPEIPDGHKKYEHLGIAEKSKDNDYRDAALDNGWPKEMVNDDEIAWNRKGSHGMTLAFMRKNAYDADKHGTS